MISAIGARFLAGFHAGWTDAAYWLGVYSGAGLRVLLVSLCLALSIYCIAGVVAGLVRYEQ